MKRFTDWFYENIVNYEGSTRAAALMRVAFVMLLWRKISATLILTSVMTNSPKYLLLAPLLWLSSIFMFIGFYSRLSTLSTGLLCAYGYYRFGIYGGDDFWRHHHVYLLIMLITCLGFTDCGRSLSLDRWLAVRRATRQGTPIPKEHGELWGLRLIGFQLSMCYFFGAYDKTHLGFPERMEHYLMDYLFSSDYPPFIGFSTLCLLLAIGTVALEYWLSFAFYFQRQRPYAIAVGVLLHVAFFQILRVSTFSATMVVAYLAYVRPETVHRIIDDLFKSPPPNDGDQRTKPILVE